MKKIVLPLLALTVTLSLSGCGVTQSSYDAVLAEKESLQTSLEAAESELRELQKKSDSMEEGYSALEAKYAALEKEYADYKKEMIPFERMTEAQAEAERAKAEKEIEDIKEAEAQKKAEEEAAAAAKEAEEKAAKEAEEALGYETGITYDQLARTPDDYEGKKIKFYGKVLQVMEDSGLTALRIAVDGNYDTVLYAVYDSSITTSRVLKDDMVTVYGYSAGLYSYQSTMSGVITIPSMIVEKIEQ